MNKFKSYPQKLMMFTPLLLSVLVASCSSDNNGGGAGGGGAGSVQVGENCTLAACVSLGTAGNYAVLANTGIDSSSGAALITGSIATGPGVTSTAITGFALVLPAASPFATSTQVTGKVYAYDYAAPTPTEMNTASLDMGLAYTTAAGRPAGVGATNLNLGAGILTDQTLVAGTYTWGSAVTIPTNLTLSGSSTDVWIFQISGTLGMSAAKSVILTGGALPQNIFWQVAGNGGVTLGAGTHFEGIVLAKTAINFGAGATSNGRLLAQTAVNLIDASTVTQP